MTDVLTLELWLAEARLARHKLLTGSKAVSMTYEGKAVTYTTANAARLDAYITDLTRQIAAVSGVKIRRGPVQFVF